MLGIDVSFELKGQVFKFKAEAEPNKKYTFTVGEPILADKLCHVLVGLDVQFLVRKLESADGKIDFSHSRANNVLALGDGTMFIGGTVRHNIYKALRVRASRAVSKTLTDEVIQKYALAEIAGKKIKTLSDDDLLKTALARAHFRDIKLVIINCCGTYIKSWENIQKNFTRYKDLYIIEIS